MGLRDTVNEWLKEGKDIKAKSPLCSKRLVVENLWEVYGLLEDDFRDLAKEKINLIKRNESFLLSNQKKDESQKIAFLEIYEDEIDYVYEQDTLMIAPILDSIKSNKIENEIY